MILFNTPKISIVVNRIKIEKQNFIIIECRKM